jgi:hypothetical protein
LPAVELLVVKLPAVVLVAAELLLVQARGRVLELAALSNARFVASAGKFGWKREMGLRGRSCVD